MFELTDQALTPYNRSWLSIAGVANPVGTTARSSGDHLEAAHQPTVEGCARAVRGAGRPATAGCAAGSGMGPGPGSGRGWPPASTAQATIAAARRRWRGANGSTGRGTILGGPEHPARRDKGVQIGEAMG